ncbi:hypothetical protein ACFL2U_02055 [Patescibacteria group bacterium]
MKIEFNQKFNQSADFLIRRCAYGLVRDPRADERSYSRRLGHDIYPRFHVYINSEDPLVYNLHLDQKQASYQGQTAHSGDYDSDIVQKEGQRIYQTVLALKAGEENEHEEEDLREEKGFFSGLFGKK